MVLAGLIAQRGSPAHLRSDNGPEFAALAVQAWLKTNAIGALYIAPGSPWENAYVESFNSRLRDEHLNREEFASLLEAQVLAAEGRRDYNEARPHSSLEYLASTVFAARWSSRDDRLHGHPSLRTGLADLASGSLDAISERERELRF